MGRKIKQTLFIVALVIGIANLGEAATYTVTNLNDSGNGSFRWALSQASSNSGSDTIKFDPSLKGGTIFVTSGELWVQGCKGARTIIDASDIWNTTTNMPGITIDGSRGGSWEGINFSAKNCEVYGLYVTGFKDDALEPGSGASGIIIGGPGHKANVLGGCGGESIELKSSNSLIYGNYIGVTPNGAPIPSGGCSKGLGGIVFCYGASNNRVEKNIIAHNYGCGIKSWNAYGDGNLITQNSFYQNKNRAESQGINCPSYGLGIDFCGNNKDPGDGVSLNDGQKKSNEFNDGMDYPVFTTADLSEDRSTLYVKGFVGSLPGQAAFANSSVEVFIADPDPTGFGEGKTYLGTIITGSIGNFEGKLDVSEIGGFSVGNYLTGTATDPNNNTSEFSPILNVIPGCQ